MKEQTTISKTFRIITLIFIFIGAFTFILGLISDPQRTWANYLIVNYYFLSLAMGGAFFLAIQNISQSGWSAAFRRIPEAMMAYIPFAAVFFLLLWFGINDLYLWSHKEAVPLDPLLQHKSHFLNVPFFFTRMIIYFALWIFLTRILRKISLREDQSDPANQDNILSLFSKSERYSKIFIFVL